MRTVIPPLFAVMACFAVACCALGQNYQQPSPAAPTAWSAPLPHGGRVADLIDWWDHFGDPVLPRLIAMAEIDSPSLVVAWANMEKARATLVIQQAEGQPTLTAKGSGQRAKQQTAASGSMSGALPGIKSATVRNTLTGALDASWEIDLFGKVRRNGEAAEARIEARTDDWHEARVSLAAEVADSYVQYCACRLLADADSAAARSQEATALVTEKSASAGLTAPADAALARAAAAAAQAALTAQRAECDVLVKALVALTATEEGILRELLAGAPLAYPQPAAFDVNVVPATVLAQRPDLAALERELAATSAEIGAAEADRYPSLSLTGSITRSGTSLGTLMTGWAVGPSLSLPIFDWGKKAAAVDTAQASYDAQLARYRQGIRDVFKEVEQALVRLDGTTRRTADLQIAADGYARYFRAIDQNWRGGGANLLNREEARRNALNAEINVITVQRDRLQYWIALYKALGGGWQSAPRESGAPS